MSATGEVGRLETLTEAQLRHLAYRDDLTGLPNRVAMAERIEAAVQRSRREASCTALLFIDLDGFKRVNNTLGHPAGDELLTRVGDRLRALREPGLDAGRQGGDEFVLLLVDLPHDPDRARSVVEEVGRRVLSALQEPFTVARCSFEISASIGASIFPADASTHHELISHADQAMYLAKTRGRAQMAMFDEPQSFSLLELESTLLIRRALSNGELELFYQPVVEIAYGHELSCLEALVRWRDPDRGLVLPGAFLPFVEHSALAVEIGEWVFSEVCRQMAAWSSRGFHPQISFNVPGRQLQRPDFADFVIDTAAKYGTDLRRLTVEITETSLLSLEAVLPTLAKLRDAGMLLSLDDFGTGYSSLARLRSMPFTLIKTDRSFLEGVPGDAVAEELLEGIIKLGNALGMGVVVEGVESAEQEREVMHLGARMAQGYQLGSPAPALEIEAHWSPALDAAL